MDFLEESDLRWERNPATISSWWANSAPPVERREFTDGERLRYGVPLNDTLFNLEVNFGKQWGRLLH